MSFLDLKSEVPLKDQWAHRHAFMGTTQEYRRHARGNNDMGFPMPKAPVEETLPWPNLEPEKPITKPIEIRPGKNPNVVKFGVIGAGAAGLFTGMLLDYLNHELELKGVPLTFQYEILEAAGPDRVGGRLYTHNFSKSKDTRDYYDVGAMRFPDNPVMARIFALFKILGMKKIDLKSTPKAKDGSLITYYMNNGGVTSGKEPWCYNNKTVWGATYFDVQAQGGESKDPFNINTGEEIPKELFAISPGNIMKELTRVVREQLKEDLKTSPPGTKGWEMLMSYDQFSTRQFLATRHTELEHMRKVGPFPPPPYNYNTIEWLETFNGGTNWYDQAHSETVLESLDFDFDDDVQWYCILGGAQQLAKHMEKKLTTKPKYNARVNVIRVKDLRDVELVVGNDTDEPDVTSYDAVFATTTLGCLQHMDLREAGLTYPTRQAIRSLGYGTAAKIAIKFRRAWWIHDLKGNNITHGGLGHSDLSVRTCVYPSYNIYDKEDSTAVLLCSYTWQQDSSRLASLFSDKPTDHALLKDLLIRDLARLHKSDEVDEKELTRMIRKNWIEHHAHDWSEDANTAGAFAFFRPQQFRSMWSRIIQPSGDVIIAGEAASPHHAWVVGALESVVHGLYTWLGANMYSNPHFGTVRDMLEAEDKDNPFVSLPPYMSKKISMWASVVSMMHREEILKARGKKTKGVKAVYDLLSLDSLDVSSAA
ncbi:hypothetical protein B0J13DRAFT_483485 [Dactylonectria estremocensis]|uniref:Amine oxidase domain-containing protein n=1 Tax=Dactylonectria estremocensis TaxID=1079267 RepID=A0A9P9DY95_9HYPO|nr:hypothetical protein B0J13DRAFT_483485 [Dactylonectria estremocensis]